MKTPSIICGMLGILIAVIAVAGRFHGPPTVTLFGVRATAAHVLIVANTLLLIGLFLGQLLPPDKKQ